jgi:hypothetical protein
VIAVSLLLRDLPKPEDSEGRRKVARLKTLLERAAVQQVESSVAREASVCNHKQTHHQQDDCVASKPVAQPGRHPIQQRVGNSDVRHTINARRRTHEDEKATRERWENNKEEVTSSRDELPRRHDPRRGGRYDEEEDRSKSPEVPGPKAFGRQIRNTKFPERF